MIQPLRTLTVALAFIIGSLAAVYASNQNGSAGDISTATTPAATAFNTADIPAGKAVAIFAGGCFWCMEKPFDDLQGVESTISGYTSGQVHNPTYHQVSAGGTGHTEAVKIVYDPTQVSYEKLLEVFWKNIDPTVANRQFCDAGSQYRSGIYPVNAEQAALAAASKAKIEKQFDQVHTEIVAASRYYDAEEYHQDYYLKNPLRYRYYRYGCGRDKRLSELWGDSASH